jgi:predicted ester cyclase
MFGLPADGAPVEFTGIAIWRVESGRLAECWVERAALELYNRLLGRLQNDLVRSKRAMAR